METIYECCYHPFSFLFFDAQDFKNFVVLHPNYTNTKILNFPDSAHRKAKFIKQESNLPIG